jgi:ammonium transporter, Amt family
VSVTSSSSNIELWAACVIGLIGSMIYTSTKKLIVRAEIDDPLDISEVHGFCGIWSIIALGIFDKDKGLIYTGKLDQLFMQIIGACSYVLWSTLLSFTFFYSLK